ncbi:hypothetical protein [Hymenobacter elongatus]|uniref:Uncharacterized protein n=1 Tax=Hymenobacter elongatus TaxID=877208 RepID=A0A4Z0PIZ2_9BACT|nr:hypothetical protein [Hymenobacter elongatus]TGE15158.1 hypothetical protein E5J99_13180 [Hymenobacter elongatus]
MKRPVEYLESHVFEARRPRRELQEVVAYTDAVQAIESALADAEKYKYLLMRALRRHADDTRVVLTGDATFSTPVLPLFPTADQQQAA